MTFNKQTKMIDRFSIALILAAFMFACVGCPKSESPFSFTESSHGVELLENGQPVFFYQRTPIMYGENFLANHYFHPVFNLDGDTLTELSPDDHPHHRGVFWAWPQHFVGEQRVGSSWAIKDFNFEVRDLKTIVNQDHATIELSVIWKSPEFGNNDPFLEEHTSVSVHRQKENIRTIDFEIALHPLVPDVSIGGSENEKGYGGFCMRIKMPDDLVFTSVDGPVDPQTLQIEAGPWMDFSASFGKQEETSGITLLCHPSTPNYPAPWILRQKNSMQNIVFPGQERLILPVGKPTILRYRLVIHRGSASIADISQWHAEYREYLIPL